MFGDIDLVFFGGWLRGNVEVGWVTTNVLHRMGQMIDIFGMTTRLQPGKCRIVLNSSNIFDPPPLYTPFEQMWSTMVHEMWYVWRMDGQ